MAKEESSLRVGEEVMVQWEGSRKYFKATVRHIKTQSCEVVFEDGTERSVPKRDLQRIPVEPMKGGQKTTSPGRRRSSSQGRSKTSSKSPEKPSPSHRRSSRARSKTPTPSPEKRRGRPPSRSPSRSKKSPTRKPPATPPTPRRGRVSQSNLMLKEVNISLEKVPIPVKRSESKTEEERRYPTRKRVVPGVESVKEMKEEVKEIKSVAHPSTSTVTATSGPAGVSTKCPKGATLVSLLLIALLAVGPLFLYLACTKNKGTLFALPPVPKRVQSYLSLKTMGIYLGWVVFQALLMFLPLGKTVPQPFSLRLQYRMNGLYSLLVTAATISAMAYYQLPLGYFNENILRTIVTSFLFAVVASIFLYAKSFFSKSQLANNSGNFLYDFLFGRELNPCLWKTDFDLKLFILRLGFMGMATVVSLLLYKCFVTHGCISYQLGTVAFMQLLYVVSTFWREETLLATATFMYEGVGHALVVTCTTLMPFVNTLPVLYLSTGVSTRSQPWWCLGSELLVFLVGLYLSRTSLWQKYTFKTNPFNPAISHLETIPKDFTRCLLSSGLWGFVRHPNYLGEILMYLAWTLPCGFTSVVPYVPFVCTTVGLIVRTFTLENGVRRRRSQAWTQYTNRVRHRLVPYVF